MSDISKSNARPIFPADVLLRIADYSELKELSSLISTCRDFKDYLSSHPGLAVNLVALLNNYARVVYGYRYETAYHVSMMARCYGSVPLLPPKMPSIPKSLMESKSFSAMCQVFVEDYMNHYFMKFPERVHEKGIDVFNFMKFIENNYELAPRVISCVAIGILDIDQVVKFCHTNELPLESVDKVIELAFKECKVLKPSSNGCECQDNAMRTGIFKSGDLGCPITAQQLAQRYVVSDGYIEKLRPLMNELLTLESYRVQALIDARDEKCLRAPLTIEQVKDTKFTVCAALLYKQGFSYSEALEKGKNPGMFYGFSVHSASSPSHSTNRFVDLSDVGVQTENDADVDANTDVDAAKKHLKP